MSGYFADAHGTEQEDARGEDPHAGLADDMTSLAAEKGFAEQVWGLSLFAQAELDNGDVEGAKKTLVRIAEVAAAMSANQ